MTTAQTPMAGSGPPERDPTVGIDSETAGAPGVAVAGLWVPWLDHWARTQPAAGA